MAELLYRLGKGSAKRAWVVIGAWIVVLAIAGAGFLIGYKGLSSSFDIPGTASGAVTDDLAKKLPKFSGASGTVVLTTKDGSAFTDAQKTAIADRIESAKDLPDVSGVTDPFSTEKQRADQQQQITDGRRRSPQRPRSSTPGRRNSTPAQPSWMRPRRSSTPRSSSSSPPGSPRPPSMRSRRSSTPAGPSSRSSSRSSPTAAPS